MGIPGNILRAPRYIEWVMISGAVNLWYTLEHYERY
jgi:hypothetical protein